jgi:beta-fructofuranosidase
MANGSTSAIGVQASGMELWDGLVNAWPARAENTSRGLVWDGPTASLFGLWAGI